jgi:hypothetical protein
MLKDLFQKNTTMNFFLDRYIFFVPRVDEFYLSDTISFTIYKTNILGRVFLVFIFLTVSLVVIIPMQYMLH